ncbi:MAG: FAD-dependent oxidoreductase [Casimicrobiaceae bacterium]
MRILVLGAGVTGVTAAWYLAQDGHEVTVVDRQPGAAFETSFANGGQISASYAEPWAIAIEPALAQCRKRIVGGIYTATDESGDAHRFSVELAKLAAAKGASFRWGATIRNIERDGNAVSGVRIATAERDEERMEADAYVVALGSYSPLFLALIGVPCNVYPAKGYSATIGVDFTFTQA